MAKTGAKPKLPPPLRDRSRRDLVPDETSGSYRFIDGAARDGERVDTTGMTEAEARRAFLGDRTDG